MCKIIKYYCESLALEILFPIKAFHEWTNENLKLLIVHRLISRIKMFTVNIMCSFAFKIRVVVRKLKIMNVKYSSCTLRLVIAIKCRKCNWSARRCRKVALHVSIVKTADLAFQCRPLICQLRGLDLVPPHQQSSHAPTRYLSLSLSLSLLLPLPLCPSDARLTPDDGCSPLTLD
jgi:hypothetical protein